MTRYGFYSERAAEIYGTFWWSTSDEKEVEVTAVYLDEEGRNYKQNDKISVGIVIKYIKQGKAPRRSSAPLIWALRDESYLVKYFKEDIKDE